MPNGFKNWSFRAVVSFLKMKNFKLSHSRGSHFYYHKNINNKNFLVSVPFHGNKAIKPRTLKSIIVQSGITEGEWLK